VTEKIRVFYNDIYEVELEDSHRFPMEKYALLRSALTEQGIVQENSMYAAELIDKESVYLAHAKEYVDGVFNQTLEHKRARIVGLPLNEQMLNRTRSSIDAVVKSAFSAKELGFSSSLCGGTHHASFDRGEGFCFFNDFAIAIALLNKIFRHRVLILDLDVHQGNGNSSIFRDDDFVDVISFHGEKNYPFKKVPSTIDHAFPDTVTDLEYLVVLKETLVSLSAKSYDVVLYQAGVDSLKEDSLGTLNLSYECLSQRDNMVFEFAKFNDYPLSMSLGGGYSNPIDATIKAYVNTYKAAKSVFGF
jgi:acetoin utilization deacetylase AcuC-like enzyme